MISSLALNNEQQSKVKGSPVTATYTNKNSMEHFGQLLAAE